MRSERCQWRFGVPLREIFQYVHHGSLPTTPMAHLAGRPGEFFKSRGCEDPKASTKSVPHAEHKIQNGRGTTGIAGMQRPMPSDAVQSRTLFWHDPTVFSSSPDEAPGREVKRQSQRGGVQEHATGQRCAVEQPVSCVFAGQCQVRR